MSISKLTDDLKISSTKEMISPSDLINELPMSEKAIDTVLHCRSEIADILNGDELKAQFGGQMLHTKDLIFLIEKLLRKKILNSISLTKKAGYLAIGLDTIKTQLIGKKNCLIVVAKGAKSLKNYSFFSSNDISCFENVLYQEDLERSTGKNNVKYVGILSKNFKKTIQVDLNKLKGFMETD